jgi:hypothetical protein
MALIYCTGHCTHESGCANYQYGFVHMGWSLQVATTNKVRPVLFLDKYSAVDNLATFFSEPIEPVSL